MDSTDKLSVPLRIINASNNGVNLGQDEVIGPAEMCYEETRDLDSTETVEDHNFYSIRKMHLKTQSEFVEKSTDPNSSGTMPEIPTHLTDLF